MDNLLLHGTLAAVFTSLFAGLGGFLIFCKKNYSHENIDFKIGRASCRERV